MYYLCCELVLPVKWVVKVWKYPHEKSWVRAVKIVSDPIQNCKSNVKTVHYIEADQYLVKGVFHFWPKQKTNYIKAEVLQVF